MGKVKISMANKLRMTFWEFYELQGKGTQLKVFLIFHTNVSNFSHKLRLGIYIDKWIEKWKS